MGRQLLDASSAEHLFVVGLCARRNLHLDVSIDGWDSDVASQKGRLQVDCYSCIHIGTLSGEDGGWLNLDRNEQVPARRISLQRGLAHPCQPNLHPVVDSCYTLAVCCETMYTTHLPECPLAR